MVYAAIDYSFTSPAMVVYTGEDYYFYYMHKTKSRVQYANHLNSRLIEFDSSVSQDIKDEKIGSSMSRFKSIAEYFIGIMDLHNVGKVFLEGYSLGSKGKVFSIAENTAVLKYMLMERGTPVTIFPPTTVKKFASGKGNANKDIMKEAYESAETPKYLAPISNYKDSPYTDCIDAYWILQYGLDKEKKVI